MTDRLPNLRQLVRRAVSDRQQQAAAEQAVKNDPRIAPPQRPATLALVASEGATRRRVDFQRAHEALAQYRQEFVLAVPPRWRAETSTEAVAVAAVVGQAEHWSPSVWRSQMALAIGHQDRALVSALLPMLESFLEYRKPFAESAGASNALVDGQQFLDQQPEVVQSKANAEWATSMAGDLVTLEKTLAEPNALEALEAYQQSGVFTEIL
jgi:hypothetical protein